MRRLRVICVVALALSGVLGTSACTMWKEPKVSTWKSTTSVEAMERLLWQEVQAGNWVEVEAHLASNFTMSTAGGVLDKQQALAHWKSEKHDNVALGEFAVADHGATTVVTYTLAVGDGPLERRMSVWQKHKEGWVVIAHAENDGSAHAPKM